MTPRSERLPTLFSFAAALFLAIMYLASVPLAASKNGDFVHLWTGARAVAMHGGEHLYDPVTHREIILDTGLPESGLWFPRNDELGVFFYPPQAAILYLPFALMDLHTAQAVQAIVTWVLILACSALLPVGRSPKHRFMSAALLFASPAVFASFGLGQNGVISLFIIAAATSLERRGALLSAGLMLSLLVFKPTWLVAFGWYPLLTMRCRFIAGVIGGVVLSTAAAGVICGFESFHTYAGLAPKLASLHDLPHYSATTQHSVAALLRAVAGESAGRRIFYVIALTIIAGVILRFREKSFSSSDNARRVAAALCAAAILNPHVHYYDAVVYCGALVIAATVEVPRRLERVHLTVLAVGAALTYLDPMTIRNIGELQPGTLGSLPVFGWMLYALPHAEDPISGQELR